MIVIAFILQHQKWVFLPTWWQPFVTMVTGDNLRETSRQRVTSLRAIAEGDNTQCTRRHHSCLPPRDLFSTNEIKCLILKDNNSHNERGQQVVPHLGKSHTREWVYWTCLVIHMKMSLSARYYLENLNLKLFRRSLEGSFLTALSIFKEWVSFLLFTRFFPHSDSSPGTQNKRHSFLKVALPVEDWERNLTK